MIGRHRGRRERESRAGEGAAQVVAGVAVAAGKVRTGEPENLVHLGGSPTLPEQVPRDPPIDNAPIGLRETFVYVPALQAALIDPGGERRGDTRGIIRPGRVGTGDQSCRRRRCQRSCRLQQRLGLRRQTSLGFHDLDPGGHSRKGCVVRASD